LVDKELKFIFTKMDILSYLAEVIQTNKEVGVPELGTFFKKKSPGRYDAERHSFLPPSYQLAFSPEVTEDTLLSEYISKHHNLSEESAIYHIDQFVANLKERLADDGEVDLKALGKFVLTAGELKFYPNPELNLGFKFYGLPDTAAEITTKEEPPAIANEIPTPIDKEEVAVNDQDNTTSLEEQAVITDPNNLEKAGLPAEQEEAISPEKAEALEAIITENNIEEENPGNLPDEAIYMHEPEVLVKEPAERSTPTYLKVIIAILALLCIAMALFLWNPVWFDNLIHRNNSQLPVSPVTDSVSLYTDTASLRDTPHQESINQAVPVGPDSVKKDSVPATQPVTSAPATSAAVAKAEAPLPKGTTFEIIGSSVYSEKEAEQFIASMKRKWGINAKVVSKRPGKKIKISIATYKDEKTARSERARLEEKIKIPGLYIYTNTHKQD
jgi:hypothetical protein